LSGNGLRDRDLPGREINSVVVVLACAAAELVEVDPADDVVVVLDEAAAPCAMLMYSTLPA